MERWDLEDERGTFFIQPGAIPNSAFHMPRRKCVLIKSEIFLREIIVMRKKRDTNKEKVSLRVK